MFFNSNLCIQINSWMAMQKGMIKRYFYFDAYIYREYVVVCISVLPLHCCSELFNSTDPDCNWFCNSYSQLARMRLHTIHTNYMIALHLPHKFSLLGGLMTVPYSSWLCNDWTPGLYGWSVFCFLGYNCCCILRFLNSLCRARDTGL